MIYLLLIFLSFNVNGEDYHSIKNKLLWIDSKPAFKIDKSKSKEIFTVLKQIINNKNELNIVKARAFFVLTKIECNMECINFIKDFIENENNPIKLRRRAIFSLYVIQKDKSFNFFKTVLHDKSPEIREAVIRGSKFLTKEKRNILLKEHLSFEKILWLREISRNYMKK